MRPGASATRNYKGADSYVIKPGIRTAGRAGNSLESDERVLFHFEESGEMQALFFHSLESPFQRLLLTIGSY
jgi:hypothetical protein